MSKSEINIELHSKIVQEVLLQTPHWLLRSGITSMLLFLIVLLVGCWFFKYPDSITATIAITGDNSTNAIVAKTNGSIEIILVKNNQNVEKNDALAIVKNDANYRDILFLKSKLDSAKFHLQVSDSCFVVPSSTKLSLGKLNSYYGFFEEKYMDYFNNKIFNYHDSLIKAMNKELVERNNLIDNLREQIKLREELYKLVNEQYTRDSMLFYSQKISENTFKNVKEKRISLLVEIKEIENEILSSCINIKKLQQSKLESEKQKSEKLFKQKYALNIVIDSLTYLIQDWEEKYILKSPRSGIVAYTNYWSTNQVVNVGDTVFNVISNDITHFIGHIQLPLKNSGKIEIGQKVIIKLDDYPYMDYGILQGEISSIAKVPFNNYYYAEVYFSSKLVTSFGNVLPEIKEFKGDANIITQDYRLLYRIIQPLKILVDKNRKL